MRKHIMKYMACLVMLLLTFAACSPDSDASDPGSITNKTYTLHFNLSPVSGSSASSRAETYTAGSPNTWEDGSKEENMKSWTVVFVKSDGTVAKVVKQPSVEEDKDKKDDVTVTGLEAGTYSVYSFANISDAELGPITEGSPSPDFDSKSFAVNGNDMDITANGIPMSNKQKVTIGSDGQPDVKDLYVVRMLSKITLKFRNMTGQDITVKNVSISDITSNPATGTENVKLLPAKPVSSANVPQAPNLVENAKRDDFTRAIGLTVTKDATDYDTDNSRSVSFYVNESQAGNAYPYFVVTLETNVGSQRYFMYTDWNQIARNDHHVLKLALSDYKLRLKVEDFGAIGSAPSLKDDGKQLNLIFHDLEEFHIIPSVTKYSDPTGAEVSFTDLKWMKLSEPETDAETKAFSTIPKIVTGENRIEAATLGELGKKIGPIIYQLSVKVNDTPDSPTLVYRVAISQDLTWYSARRHNGAFWICKQ
uniref:fimbrial protein n=1 Tax=Segatella hominis TaxID=2518605 RepID=UPI004026A650